MKNLLLVTTLLLSQNLLASEQCTKEMQNKVNNILKICKDDDGTKVCDIRLSSNCQKVLDDVNTKLTSLNKSIHDQLMSADLDSAAAVKKINQDITTSFKIAATLSTPSQAREMKVQQEKILGQFQRMLKKDSQFLTRVHPNGMTSREIYQKFQDQNYQLGIVKAFNLARDRSRTDKTKDFKQHFVETFQSIPELQAIYAAKSQNDKARNIAENQGFGLRVFACAYKEVNGRVETTDFHAFVYGQNHCGRKHDYDIEEHIIGPGLMYNWISANALVCVNYGNEFKGVGVTASAYAAFGANVGVYIGAFGSCIRVGAGGGIGLRAGLSYIRVKDPVAVLATSGIISYEEETAKRNKYKEEIVELK